MEGYLGETLVNGVQGGQITKPGKLLINPNL